DPRRRTRAALAISCRCAKSCAAVAGGPHRYSLTARPRAAADRRTQMIGQTLSHYRILEKLGDGATAVVYKAEDLALGRAVVLKLVPPELSADYAMNTRFQHEARTASSLNHPNICTIYEIAEDKGHLFIVMELLEGQVLSRAIGGRPL